MHVLGRILAVADHLDWCDYRLEVMDIDKNRVDKVLVSRLPSPPPQSKAVDL